MVTPRAQVTRAGYITRPRPLCPRPRPRPWSVWHSVQCSEGAAGNMYVKIEDTIPEEEEDMLDMDTLIHNRCNKG